MKLLTRILTGKQAIAENIQRLAELAASDALRANKTPRINIAAGDDAPAPPSISDFNAGIRAAINRADDGFVTAGADVNGIAPPPSLNASIINFVKKGFAR